jgi:lipooligosaccharide transport system permease protein
MASLYLVVVWVVGAVPSPWALLWVPVAVLTTLSFAAPMIAFTATQYSDRGITLFFRFAVTPLFLFSGTYFPVEQLPIFLQPLAWVTPMYHGIAAARSLSSGHIDPIGLPLHLGALAVFICVGIWLGRKTFPRRLEV